MPIKKEDKWSLYFFLSSQQENAYRLEWSKDFKTAVRLDAGLSEGKYSELHLTVEETNGGAGLEQKFCDRESWGQLL